MICKILRRTTRRSIMRRAVPRRGDICTRRKCRSTPPLQVKAPRQRYMPPSPYDKQRRYISYGNKRHTVCPTHLKEDIRSTPCPYRARITCRFCPRCNDDARRENPASPHRIIAAPTKWMTPEYPPHRHPSAAPRAVPLNRLHRVRGRNGEMQLR